MSSQEWKSDQQALDDGNAVKCPNCGKVIYLDEIKELLESS